MDVSSSEYIYCPTRLSTPDFRCPVPQEIFSSVLHYEEVPIKIIFQSKYVPNSLHTTLKAQIDKLRESRNTPEQENKHTVLEMITCDNLSSVTTTEDLKTA